VAAVLAFHGRLGAAPGGFLGVSAFFTLSGFLVTSLLLTQWERTERIGLPALAGIRPDGLHFSDAGADLVARWLGPRLATVVRTPTAPSGPELAARPPR